MTIPVATALRRRDRFWPAAILSAAIHATAVVLALSRAQPPLDLDRTSLHAHLVRLGEPKPETFLPRKDLVQTPVATAPPSVAPAVAPASPTTAASAPLAATPQKVVKKAALAASSPTPRNSTLASVASRVQHELVKEERSPWGDPNGDLAGDASEAEGDRYAALVVTALKNSYELPSTISEKERLYLSAVVRVFIEPDGHLLRFTFEKRSGNAEFDDALERTVRAARLPPPPDTERELCRRTGLLVNFKI